MRTEAEATLHRRMTRGAIALRVTGSTRFQALTSGLAMSEAEATECVVIAFRSEPRYGDEPCLLMAGLTELGSVVTVTAVGFTRICRARMPRQEILWMIP